MFQLTLIALGGALGALARHGLAAVSHGLWGAAWPLGTLAVNGSGSLAIGVVFVLIERAVVHPEWRGLLVVGFLGAFTTFSTYSLECVQLWLQGLHATAVAYAVASVVVCLAAAALGVIVTRALLA